MQPPLAQPGGVRGGARKKERKKRKKKIALLLDRSTQKFILSWKLTGVVL